ncbi:aminomethyl-transferring glycine dehydrogenase subunit GcvPA [Xylanibacillus composti]|nr:aminomethyl-transferring glycine dehydrogenase subunit GcvPA [Xylanibacillus composti]MDT9724928.1 aminomethyl-transferring glycine dehydrogenase subunit GcvPA [Xylanibacillus composti]
MMHRYLPMTEEDRKEMLAAVGVAQVEELFRDIPEQVRLKRSLQVSERMDERSLLRYMRGLSGKNADFDQYASFLGAGLYDHHVPVVLNHVLSRSEFYTAYTPYQPEISQGELQAIFEFQSYICELTGMAVANASMYDGATALGEAAALAANSSRRKRIVVSEAVHPEARQIVATVASGLSLEVAVVPCAKNGVTDAAKLREALDSETAAVLVQSPNFFGCIEDVRRLADEAHSCGALLALSVNPLALGLLEAPGKLGADIVVGDAQPFGISASFGGPTCGFFAVSEAHMRKMPGRIVGQTVDRDGKRGFVLTLQAREQHIRREKATSNICSNQALLALAASVYLSVMGKQGLQEVAKQNVSKSHYAQQALTAIPGVEAVHAAPFFNEFAVRLPAGTSIAAVNEQLLEHGYIGGLDLGQVDAALTGCMLVAVTECRTREEIDGFARALEVALG